MDNPDAVVGFKVGEMVVCLQCVTDAEAKQDEDVILRNDMEGNVDLYFCDRCFGYLPDKVCGGISVHHSVKKEISADADAGYEWHEAVHHDEKKETNVDDDAGYEHEEGVNYFTILFKIIGWVIVGFLALWLFSGLKDCHLDRDYYELEEGTSEMDDR